MLLNFAISFKNSSTFPQRLLLLLVLFKHYTQVKTDANAKNHLSIAALKIINNYCMLLICMDLVIAKLQVNATQYSVAKTL